MRCLTLSCVFDAFLWYSRIILCRAQPMCRLASHRYFSISIRIGHLEFQPIGTIYQPEYPLTNVNCSFYTSMTLAPISLVALLAVQLAGLAEGCWCRKRLIEMKICCHHYVVVFVNHIWGIAAKNLCVFVELSIYLYQNMNTGSALNICFSVLIIMLDAVCVFLFMWIVVTESKSFRLIIWSKKKEVSK